MPKLDATLHQFENAEGNLAKLEQLWTQISVALPGGPAFGAPEGYDRWCHGFRTILPHLPAIDGFRVEDKLFDYDEVGQMRLDALEIGEISATVSIDHAVEEQGLLLREYRFRFDGKRSQIIRQRVFELVDIIDASLRELVPAYSSHETNEDIEGQAWELLKEAVTEIDALLGSAPRPSAWDALWRHMHFHMVVDLLDIQNHDWPAVKQGLRSSLYGQNDPLPVEVADLGDLAKHTVSSKIVTKLNWQALSAEDFERLLFLLLSDTPGYENAEWLQKTNAPDRGRDLSVTRVSHDPLISTRRERVIVQCKHWLSKSVNVSELATAMAQMELWQPPRVDVLIVATSGRFSADAVDKSEKHNQSDHALKIELWPESHLERLLASRPHLIAQFSLRQTS